MATVKGRKGVGQGEAGNGAGIGRAGTAISCSLLEFTQLKNSSKESNFILAIAFINYSAFSSLFRAGNKLHGHEYCPSDRFPVPALPPLSLPSLSTCLHRKTSHGMETNYWEQFSAQQASFALATAGTLLPPHHALSFAL